MSRREQFLESTDETIPWDMWVGLIEPFYYDGKRAVNPHRCRRCFACTCCRCASRCLTEGVEDAFYDSYAMRRFMKLDFAVAQVPEATTLLHFRHLIEKHGLGETLLAAQTAMFDEQGWIMRGGSIVEATIIAAPSSTKNATGERDREMHQTKKGNQWYIGMKAHIGVDTGTGYIHSVTRDRCEYA